MAELTVKQQYFLANSPEFDAVLAHDPVLKELDAARIDYARERELLHESLGGVWSVGNIDVPPLTPAVWSILWVLKSPFTRKNSQIRVIDVAVFLYLLSHPLSDIHLSTVEEDAKAAGAEWGLPEDAPAMTEELLQLLEIAFSPLKMLPETVSNGEEIFDSDWLLSVCSTAAAESGETLHAVMTDFPLSVVFGLLVVRARKANPGNRYTKRSPEWVSKKELERTNELAAEFCAAHMPPEPGEEIAGATVAPYEFKG